MLPQSWPRWTLVIVGLVLATVAVVAGLLLQPLAVAVAPAGEPEEAELPAVNYAMYAESEGCRDCHFSLAALEASASDAGKASEYLVESESVTTPHGRLGCQACHAGNGEANDKTAAHEGLIADLTEVQPGECMICHYDLPVEIPDDRLKVPHQMVLDRFAHGEALDVWCSDCHGQVGHGFDPVSHDIICNMTICIECHVERNLDVSLSACDACHIAPHDIALSCDDCHLSTLKWQEVDLSIHPKPLDGQHGETPCFSCHGHPNFRGLVDNCSACHTRAHDFGSDECAQCHDPAASAWSISEAGWADHSEIWPGYVGTHTSLSCFTCHDDPSFKGMDSTCGACHSAPHSFGGTGCSECHEAASGDWVIENASWSGHADVWDAYRGAHETATCTTCHGGGAFAGMDSTCAACHAPAHEFGGDDCSQCHDVEAGWTFEGEGWPGHLDVWDQYKGKHTTVDCIGCHFSGYEISPECVTCHEAPRSHASENYSKDCTMCHQADAGWKKS